MLFPEEEAPILKAWIVKRLENTLVPLPGLPAYWRALANTRVIGLMPTPMSLRSMSWPYFDMMAA